MTTWSFLDGDGEALALVRNQDWSKSPIGVPDEWPEALRAILNITLQSVQPAFLVWGEQRILLYNDAYVPICGHRHPAMGQPFDEVWSDLDVAQSLMDQAYAGQSLHLRDVHIPYKRFDKIEDAYFSFSYTPIRDHEGAVCGVFCHCYDTTAEVMSRTRMAEEHNRLKRLFEQSPSFMALLSGPEHRIEFGNTEYIKLVGGRDVVGKAVKDAIPEATDQGYLDLLDRVFAGETYRGNSAAFNVVKPDGKVDARYVDFVYQPVLEENNQISGIFVQGHDVTERIVAEERYRLLLQEMNHRVKNMFAVLASLLTMSGRRAADVPTLVQDMRQRISALANAHDLITTAYSGGQHDDLADLQKLLNTLLMPYVTSEASTDRLQLDGPPCMLKGHAITVLTLILHEHATNAAKYGALSAPAGYLVVEWAYTPDGLTLHWIEYGGPLIHSTPQHSGFGSSLAEAMVNSLGASLSHNWVATGLEMTLFIPSIHIKNINIEYSKLNF